MATRFYFDNDAASPLPSLAFSSGWEQTGQADRRFSPRKVMSNNTSALANSTAITVPITTTQQILNRQYVTEPIPYKTYLAGRSFSMVIRGQENATTNNVFPNFHLRVVSMDGTIERGVLGSVMSTAGTTEWLSSQATRIFSAVGLNAFVLEAGDRLVLELGGTANAPAAAGTFIHRHGTNATSDFALTAALTTDLNPWWEMSHDFWPVLPNNQQPIRAGDGISVSESWR